MIKKWILGIKPRTWLLLNCLVAAYTLGAMVQVFSIDIVPGGLTLFILGLGTGLRWAASGDGDQ